MKSHRDRKYRREASRTGRCKSERPKPPPLLIELCRSRTGDLKLVLPVVMLTGLPIGTRLWLQVLHGAIWFNKKPIGPRGSCGRQRVSRRLRRGPPVRFLKRCSNKGCCELKFERIHDRCGKGARS